MSSGSVPTGLHSSSAATISWSISVSERHCVPSPAGLAELLADLAAALNALGAQWYVFGAQAALVWGRPRLTTDVDVTVKSGASAELLVRRLDAHGFSLRIDATETFIRTTRVVPLEHRSSGLALDVVLAGPGLEDLFIERAIQIDVAGTLVPFISPEDLIVTKLLAGREKDIEDVRGVLSERGSALNLPQIRTTLRLLEDALGQSDLLPVFEVELERWQRSGG
jgi:hypothetical protein